MFKEYFVYCVKEKNKKEIVGAVAFGVLKKVLNVQDDNKAFNSIAKLLGYDKYFEEKEAESYDSIINDLFGGKE